MGSRLARQITEKFAVTRQISPVRAMLASLPVWQLPQGTRSHQGGTRDDRSHSERESPARNGEGAIQVAAKEDADRDVGRLAGRCTRVLGAQPQESQSEQGESCTVCRCNDARSL